MTHPSTRGSICPHCSILMYSSQYHGSTCTYCIFAHELIPVPRANLYRRYLCTRPSATSQPVHHVHINSSQYHGSTCKHCSVHMYSSLYYGSTHIDVCKHPSTTGKICTYVVYTCFHPTTTATFLYSVHMYSFQYNRSTCPCVHLYSSYNNRSICKLNIQSLHTF